MNSLKTSTLNQKGFTMIELLMVMAVIAFTVGISVYMSGDFFQSNSLQSTVNAFGVSLERARSQAINNINEAPHGVKVDNGDFVIFEGSAYPGTNQQTISGNSNYTFTFTPSNPDAEIVFSQLSGNSSFNGNIVVSDGFKSATININTWGRIDF